MNQTKRKEYTLLVLLSAAMIGVVPFIGNGCNEIMVIDPETGDPRPATQAEVDAIIAQAGDTASVLAVASGNPQWVPLIQLGSQMAILATAFLYKRKIDRE